MPALSWYPPLVCGIASCLWGVRPITLHGWGGTKERSAALVEPDVVVLAFLGRASLSASKYFNQGCVGWRLKSPDAMACHAGQRSFPRLVIAISAAITNLEIATPSLMTLRTRSWTESVALPR